MRTLTSSDLVAVDVSSSRVRQVPTGFANPLAVLADNLSGRRLISDYGDQVAYFLQVVDP
jgi:hypothetical protein